MQPIVIFYVLYWLCVKLCMIFNKLVSMILLRAHSQNFFCFCVAFVLIVLCDKTAQRLCVLFKLFDVTCQFTMLLYYMSFERWFKNHCNSCLKCNSSSGVVYLYVDDYELSFLSVVCWLYMSSSSVVALFLFRLFE